MEIEEPFLFPTLSLSPLHRYLCISVVWRGYVRLLETSLHTHWEKCIPHSSKREIFRLPFLCQTSAKIIGQDRLWRQASATQEEEEEEENEEEEPPELLFNHHHHHHHHHQLSPIVLLFSFFLSFVQKRRRRRNGRLLLLLLLLLGFIKIAWMLKSRAVSPSIVTNFLTIYIYLSLLLSTSFFVQIPLYPSVHVQ